MIMLANGGSLRSFWFFADCQLNIGVTLKQLIMMDSSLNKAFLELLWICIECLVVVPTYYMLFVISDHCVHFWILSIQ